MSLKSMLAHRCRLTKPITTKDSGSAIYSWATAIDSDGNLLDNVRCYLDLNYIRQGKDSLWIEAAGRPADRTGVIFFDGKTEVRSGYRVEMLKGPEGTFSIQGAVDESWRPSGRHHLEIGVIEVATSLARGDRANNGR